MAADNNGERIYVAGHRGMVGSAIVRTLEKAGSVNLVVRSRAELDLTNQSAVREFFDLERPTQVYLAAAKVGGIHANNVLPADFIYENLMIQANVIDSAFRCGVKKLLFLGSSCIYPRQAPQPMREDALLTGPLEPTNEPYAIAKIAGIKQCESYNRQYGKSHGVDYRSVMPTNLYGLGDNYHPTHSHVVPGLVRRFHEAKMSGASTVTVWGSGTPRRQFLYVDDMAEASVFVMNLPKVLYEKFTTPMNSHINVGSSSDMTIAQVAQAIAEVVGYSGRIEFDSSKPDGAPRKWIDSDRLHEMGWRPTVGFRQGVTAAYHEFLSKQSG
jgi:GDP-L-fucose synthase